MSGIDPLQIAIYLVVLALVWVPYGLRRRRRSERSRAVLVESRELGLAEPVSLHPTIDEAECIGCAACVTACPEEDVLGLIGGKAQLIRAANCIGYGACAEACPVDAIELVFGTEKRGVEIESFQSNGEGEIVSGEPARRRNWIDLAVFTQSPGHLERVRSVRRVLDQKAALLRGDRPDRDLLEVLDVELARHGAELSERRARMLAELLPHAIALHQQIADDDG